MKYYKTYTDAQKRGYARSALFRQLHGFNLTRFIRDAEHHNAITDGESRLLKQIDARIKHLINYKFENAKLLGLHPRRRCSHPLCKNIAHWRVTIDDEDYLLCNKHKKEYEQGYNYPNFYNTHEYAEFKEINPYD